MDANATIIATSHELPFSRRYYTYEWRGKITDIARVPDVFIDMWGDNPPFPLRKIEREPWSRSTIYARKDAAFGLWALGVSLWVFIRNHTAEFYHRLILTAYVWGFAEIPFHDPPSWRHLRFRAKK